MSTADNKRAQGLAAYRKRLEEAGFRRMSAYVSLDLIAHLQSQKMPGDCMGRTLERLLLGSAKARPRYYSDEEIARKETRRQEWAMKRTQTRKAIRTEQRTLCRDESERLRQAAMERIGLLKKPEI